MLSEFYHIIGVSLYSFTESVLHCWKLILLCYTNRILLIKHSCIMYITVPEFHYIIRIPLCCIMKNSISILEFHYVSRVLLHYWNSIMYITVITWHYVKLIQLHYVTFHYLMSFSQDFIILLCVTRISINWWNFIMLDYITGIFSCYVNGILLCFTNGIPLHCITVLEFHSIMLCWWKSIQFHYCNFFTLNYWNSIMVHYWNPPTLPKLHNITRILLHY